MKFGKVDDPESVDLTISRDHPDTKRVLAKSNAKELRIYVGCAKWNKTDLKGFYPKGTKDELRYYSTQFNCVELNATFYRMFKPEVFQNWYASVPKGFKFCPKLSQSISHYRRLKEVEELVDISVANMSLLREKLGMPFLQMHNNFKPKDAERVAAFIEYWRQYKMPLAVEFRHTDWFNDRDTSARLYKLLEKYKITNVLVDTAGRRDLMHMRLTTPTAFVRWVGANSADIDRRRLDEWVRRIAKWKKVGLKNLYFFVHQNVERESPLLAAYFIDRLNKKLHTELRIPQTLNSRGEPETIC
ncbi:MAG: DUF72 domain-containing protein [Chloracidobacterium sp.]|nr:DUF72 domain-containing protein [Chloracidobacterium sp.]MCC6826458.1 DUF72 domain-containing protein [Acidobacteriota bacterium]MCO5333673.1 DUF72 domain-containing protein [Pyrinomonadaceae bacterium]